ncbi:MAG: hypothetical protein RBS08_07465 [Bdellovibrionales bacterium]|jgi:hypothetical protein|nr:hypothetical protein [Bdellovibrionales bacterium]
MAAQKKTSAKMPFSLRLSIFALLILAVVFFPSTVLFCGCMLPAFVAALVDNKPDKTAGLTVGALNFAGTVPAWLTLWSMGGKIDHAITLLLQPKTLLLAYAAAVLGWVLYFQVPGMVSGILAKRGETRLADIDRRQRELARKWGPQIAADMNAARPRAPGEG